MKFSTALPLSFVSFILSLSILSFRPLDATVYVSSPEYRSDVNGNTLIQIDSPDHANQTAVAKCWQHGAGLGADTTVATVALDAAGKGSFTFPAGSYPKGPITIRITAGGDTCHLQLYNTGGVSWKEGLAAAPTPPQAAGLSLVFADDFDGPLSISRTGEGATYGSHTVGYKDFSRPKFRDFEDSNNPFSQRDTYLRIRATTLADESGTPAEVTAARSLNWNSSAAGTGHLCSVAQNLSGFRMQVPFYMECRFIAQRAKGSWPSFWALSTPNVDGGEYAEIDVIEAYGSVAQKRYTAGIHNWPTDDARDYKLVQMDGSIAGTNAADWSDSVHTYGCLVTESVTYYYLDNVEVWNHPTRQEWLIQEFYFYFGYAFAGTSGWLSELGRYGFKSDMYVDWVRMYAIEDNGIIVDNSDANSTLVGSWSESTSTLGYNGANYLHDDNSSALKTITWTPDFPSSGAYDVYMRWTAYSNRASNAQVVINSQGNTSDFTVNQKVEGSYWKYVGTYTFDAGSNATTNSITLRNQLLNGTSCNGYVIADAVKVVPSAPKEVIVDNTDSGVVRSGSWSSSTSSPGYYGTDYEHDGDSSSLKTFTWVPQVPTNSSYDVYMQWTAYSNRASNAQVVIKHQGNSSELTVNQRVDGQVWNYIGTYAFNAGTDAANNSIALRNQLMDGTSCDGYVIADAVRIVETAAAEIIVDNTDSGTSSSGSWSDSSYRPGYYGTGYKYDGQSSSLKTFTWTPSFQQTRLYDVYMQWASYSDRASNAQVVVNFQGSSDVLSVNQRLNGGQWNYLGTYEFAQGSDALNNSVTIKNQLPGGTSCDGQVIADAVRFVPFGGVMVLDNTASEVSRVGSWLPSTYVSGYHDSNYEYASPSSTLETFTWTPSFNTTQSYRLFMKWTKSSGRANNAQIVINHQGGTTNLNVNQEIDGGQWNDLGSYTFSSGSSAANSIQIRNQLMDGTPCEGVVIADAIQIIPE
ncbi:hypothetical protein [Rubellicoccus peritrichatus]|uniref:GH16 domain-containing protein n=1 Tax=Rubellicoccus peritrichatus TaxID=3080537 RepID=A0AAQ3LGX8_9BACT|nr:hypothetical protein [Puniceicoccus sp. CR14]WOO43618.1 hypothetical protein RZN69_11010 [Puniceicoccus sp. CR14]